MSIKQSTIAWRDIAVKEIRARMERLKVKDSGELIRSLEIHVKELSSGDAYKAEILYNYYGIFPDMGVGKGQSFGDAGVAKLLGGGRRRKNWTRAVAAQRYRFGEIVQQEFAKKGTEQIKDSLKVRITLDL